MAGLAPGMPRTLAGRYRLVRLVAKGGMAEVWEGRDEVLNRPVAIKMLLAHLAADPSVRERFRREAVTAARLVHPGIVAVFDAGVEGLGGPEAELGAVLSGGWSRYEAETLEAPWLEVPSTAFIVMELVPGETLRDLMARAGPLSPELAIAIIAQVADALAYAHAQGLVHRDIKPANVLLRDEGTGIVRVKVADFGIAKAAAVGTDLTDSGELLGTPKYLSPEQVQGAEPDARADLYSVGVVLFEMLAGRAPFEGKTELATAVARVQEPAPHIDQVRPGLPRGLGELVDSLLVKDPRYRLPSALALGGALVPIRKRLGVPVPNGPGAYPDLSLGVSPVRRGDSPAGASEARTLPDGGGPRADGSGPQRLKGRAEKTLAGEGAQRRTVALPLKSTNGVAPPLGGTKSRKSRREAPLRRRKAWRRTNVVVGSLLVAGLLVAGALVRTPAEQTSGRSAGSDRGPTAPARSPTALRILNVHELTQDGNQPDDDVGQLGNLIDGNPATYWESDVYKGPEFGRSGGFGLVLQLGAAHVLHELAVSSPMKDWAAEVFTSDSDAPELSGWGSPTDKRGGIYGNATFSLAGRKASWVLFWMIDPGPSRQAVVGELSVR